MADESTAVKQTEAEFDDDFMQEMEERMQIFGAGLQTKYQRQVALKQEIEERWLDDLRHYNGVPDKITDALLSDIDKENSSKIFVNLTRSKCNTAESKWSDLVLPTDDKNWGLKPTPVPDLMLALTDETPLTLSDGAEAVDEKSGDPLMEKDLAEEIMKEATKKATLMEQEMDDQLTEAKYNMICRSLIHDAVVMGTGIIKGPMVESRKSKTWEKTEGVDGVKAQWAMGLREEKAPTAGRVDPWNFFPDMAATSWENCEFTFERHLMIRKELRKLAKQPGFLPGQIKLVLESTPNASQAHLSYLNELRQISGITQIHTDTRYEVLEYHGPIEKEDLMVFGIEVDMENPLEEYEGVVWVSGGTVIKVGLNHMDSQELPYDILNWEQDETNIFGFGVPYRMRDPQKVMNASWRMVLDNAALSTGPQILINKAVIEPADGKWEMSPRKIWWMKTKDPKMRADYAMQTFNIDNNQPALTAIFEMAHRLADEETSVPQMQMGNQPGDTQQPAMLKTLGGTALWMSSMNVMMRRAVKCFDDQITVPFLTRVYDWNMQFNPKDSIKGDMKIDARGTSVLLVREMQARNIMEFVNAAMALPGGSEELITRGVLKNMAKGMQISFSDVMRTDVESEIAVKEAKENPPQDPEMMKAQAAERLVKMKIDWEREALQMKGATDMAVAEGRRQEAMMVREVELMTLATTGEADLIKTREANGIKKYMIDWDIKKFYEEVAVKMAEGMTANYGLGE